MKLQSFFFGLEFFQVLAKHDFSYLAPYILEWNEPKLSTFMKLYIMKYNFKFCLKE